MPEYPIAVHIVLVATTHPGNIGAAARAMKTMGIGSLRLVTPTGFPSAEVTARAAGADDVLAGAVVYDSLAQAVADCGLVFATSARARSIPWPELEPDAAAATIALVLGSGSGVAVVFGRESSGLSNQELELCHGVIRIPANAGFPSLNLAAAVQIICYELRKALGVAPEAGMVNADRVPPATMAELELLYAHLEQCLIDVGYIDPTKPRRLMRRLRRLFNRARLDANEYNILRGFLAAAQKSAGRVKDQGK